MTNTTTKGEHKRGKLTKADEEFIRQNVGKMDADKIAEHLNRTPEPIKKYIRIHRLVQTQLTDGETLKDNLSLQLRARAYWVDIQKQFTQTELESFEKSWIELMLQFREDVLYAEELEIKQYLTLEILINRNLSERYKASKEVEYLQNKLDKAYKVNIEDRDINLIANLENQLSFIKTALPAYAAEYVKLLEKKQASAKDLKATRDQRIKRVEDAKTSWAGLIRAMDDEEFRFRTGDEAELMRLASNVAKEKLSELHTYIDGNVDRPLFNAETEMLDNK